MTELLEEAIARVRQLPPEEQDNAATALFAMMSRRQRDYRLTAEQAEEVRRTREGLANGTVRLLTPEETDEMWRRLGA
ncbi:MAG: hypothetical protein JOY67_04035 [Hyphomicrobiales bacterium]|nr:hypothetical protein [Hyphomicrobiales bacterium]